MVATYQGEQDRYDGIRSNRIAGLSQHCTQVFNCSFGSPRFEQLVESQTHWDALCHHAADVTDYRSPDFDISRALAANTLNMAKVVESLAQKSCQCLVLTGSVFEGGEGAGSDDLPAFSSYGVSKALTATVANYHAETIGLRFGKFIIPNPFGPLEEPRFTAYLVNTWAKGEVASVNTPDYIRDNIHVSLLAAAYAHFVEGLSTGTGTSHLNPSGYVESQGQFAERFAANLRERTGSKCQLNLVTPQAMFDEPRIRINTDPAQQIVADWSESSAWDEIAEYYASALRAAPRKGQSHE